MSDRTIHARTADGIEIVRYDRGGKWYLEHEGERTHVGLADAVIAAARPGTYVYFGERGGSAFDRRLTERVMELYGGTTSPAHKPGSPDSAPEVSPGGCPGTKQ